MFAWVPTRTLDRGVVWLCSYWAKREPGDQRTRAGLRAVERVRSTAMMQALSVGYDSTGSGQA